MIMYNAREYYDAMSRVYGLTPVTDAELEQLVGNDFDDILLAETLLAESRGVYAFNRELSGTDAYADLVTLIENHYGDWAFRVLDRYTVQALWSLADEFGAHNALEFIQSQDDENI